MIEKYITHVKRLDYMIHHIGAPATITENGKVINGRIDGVDTEDDTIAFVFGVLDDQYTRFMAPENVQMNLKYFADLTAADLISLVAASKVIGKPLEYLKFQFATPMEKTYHRMQRQDVGRNFNFTVYPNWTILCHYDGQMPFPIDNYPEVVFLLCKMGYDVTGYFKK